MWIINKLKRYVNQNTFRLILGILACLFVIFIIQILNNRAKSNFEQNKKNNASEQTLPKDTSNQSPITGVTVTGKTSEQNSDIISEFVEYCNNGNIEDAYNLLTNECKEEIFPDLEVFKNNYYKRVFDEQKHCSVQLWKTDRDVYTYKVRILNDLLSSGKYNDSVYEDYVTVVEQNDQLFLNINSFINKEEINKEITKNDITCNILNKAIYIDYEIYEIKIENKTENTILMNSGETPRTIYLTNKNETRYSAYETEIMQNGLIIEKWIQRTLKIKFNKLYNPDRKVNKFVFSDVILNYEEYKNIENKEEYKNRTDISVNI